MKYILLFSALSLVLGSCNYQFNKSGMTGLETTADGLSFENCALYVGQQQLSGNEVNVGEDVDCVFSGVSGFVQEDGMCYIGASMLVTDDSGAEIFNEADLFAQYDEEGINPQDASSLSMTLMTGNPMEVGKSYNWSMRIWDKRGKGEMTAKVVITLK